MHRRHPPFADAEALMDHLGERRQAIGRARGVRDDVVLGRSVSVIVDAQDDREVWSLGRRRDDDFLRAGRQMLRRTIAIGEDAGGLEDVI
jgi:hypothetical protein